MMRPSTRSSRSPRRVAASRPRRGFTLISMIVAMVLLGAGVMVLARANASTTVLQTLAQNRTNAIAIARAHVEAIRSKDPWLVQSEAAVRLDADGTVSAAGAYTRTVTVTTTRQNLVLVEVRVDYPRATQPLKLTTSVFRGNGLNQAG